MPDSEPRAGPAFDALPWAACLIDAQGLVVEVNRGWREQVSAAGVVPAGSLGPQIGALGLNYLDICARAQAPEAALLLRRILACELAEGEYDHVYDRADQPAGMPRRCRLHLRALPGVGPRQVLLIHEPLDPARVVEAQLREDERRLRELIEMSSDWYWETDTEHRIVAITVRRGGNRARHEAALGFRRWERPLEPVGFTWAEHIADHQAHRPYANLVFRFVDEDDQRNFWSVSGKPAFDAAGRFGGYRGVGTEVTERHRWQSLRGAESLIYERLLRDAPLAELADMMCAAVEGALYRRGRVTIQELRGDRLHLLAAPQFAPGFHAAYADGIAIGAAGGTCGAAAARGTMVVSTDIRTDPLWAPFQEVLARLEMGGACWSTPLRGAAGGVIGVFAVYHERCGDPHPRDLEMIAHAGHLAAVVIERVRAQNALAASEARFRGVVELAQDGLLIHDGVRIAYANPAMARIAGAAGVHELIGSDPFALLDESFRLQSEARRDAVLAGSTTAPFVEMQGRTLDGRLVDIEIASVGIEWAGRRMIQSQIRDVSARKWQEREILRLNGSLEQTVEDRTRELRTAIGELESFSYMVAHDLRAPLRSIDGHATLLPEDAGGTLPAQAQRDLDAIRRSAQHMGELIDALLRFSQTGRVGLALGRLATRDTVAAILAELDGERRAQVTIGPLPDLHGDPLLLRQVLFNLIGNALKYSAGQAPPMVAIDAERGDGKVLISVRDNGVGFDMAYADKLFGIFQRLHSVGQFEGLGVGLAIVRRIVERHGGRVWAESAPGAGACFRFSLPDPDRR